MHPTTVNMTTTKEITGSGDDKKLSKAHGLYPLQPSEAWVGKKVVDWPHSTFHRYVRQGVYGMDVINEQELEDFGEP